MTGGASGGVFGQLGGVIGVVMARKQPGWRDLLIQNLVYALLMGFFLRVNTAAHIGGFAVGLALGFVLEREGRRRALTPIFGALAVVGALAGVASIVASMTSPLWREIRAQELASEG
jgi:membrane associated rhomboid family serine protease